MLGAAPRAGVGAAARAGPLLVLDTASREWHATPFVEMFPEGDKRLTLEEVSNPEIASPFQQVNKRYINQGVVRGAYWYRVALKNASNAGQSFLLELSNPRLVQVDAYTPGSDGAPAHFAAGTAIAFDERPLPYSRPVFPVDLGPHDVRTIYVRVAHRGSLRFSVDVWREADYAREASWEDLRDGMFYGALLVMVLLQGVLFSVSRARSYLFLAAFTGSILLFILAARGVGFQHFWPHAPEWTERAPIVFMGCSLASAFLFAREFFDTRRQSPWLDRAFLLFAGLGALLIPARFSEGLWVNHLANFGTMAGAALLLGTGLVKLWQRQSMRLFVISWTLLCLAALAFSIALVSGLGYAYVSEYVFQAGFPLTLVVLSASVYLGFHRRERENLAKLEARVEERTRDLKAAKESVKTLQGFLPICSVCHKIRDDKGYWARLENYIASHSEAEFTHSICPDCARLMYGDVVDDIPEGPTGS